VIVVVEVPVAEEHGRRVRAQHDLGSELSHVAGDGGAQLLVVGQLAVVVAEVEVAGEAQERGGFCRLLHPEAGQLREVGVGILSSLVAPGRDEDRHVGAGLGPRRQRAASRDLRVVGMRVHGQRAGRNLRVDRHPALRVMGAATR
jgi:hypothetical protein